MLLPCLVVGRFQNVAAATNRSQARRSFRPERLPEFLDALAEGPVRHRPTAPNFLDEALFGDEAPALRHEISEYVERLLAQMGGLPCPEQALPVQIKCRVAGKRDRPAHHDDRSGAVPG